MSAKDAYVSKLKSKLDQWNSEIDVLMAKAEEAEADIRLECSKQIEWIQAKQEEARDRLEALDSASDDAWGDLKMGMEQAFDDLDDAITSAINRFR